jgi:hypothetical protein
MNGGNVKGHCVALGGRQNIDYKKIQLDYKVIKQGGLSGNKYKKHIER